MFVLLAQTEELFKQLHPLRLQLTTIHQLLVVLPPRAHVAFLGDELGGFAVVGLKEVDGFLPFSEPEFILGHNSLDSCEFVLETLDNRSKHDGWCSFNFFFFCFAHCSAYGQAVYQVIRINH